MRNQFIDNREPTRYYRERLVAGRRGATVHVYFRSGTRAETKAEVVVAAPERDLALLRVTDVADLPKPIEPDSKAEPFETMAVYTFRFPFGEKLTMPTTTSSTPRASCAR